MICPLPHTASLQLIFAFKLPLMSLRKPRVRTMRSYMRAGIKSHTSGQGFQSTSFDNEYQIIRKGWDQRRKFIHCMLAPLNRLH